MGIIENTTSTLCLILCAALLPYFFYLFFIYLILFRNMYNSVNHNRPHRFWCLQEPFMMCSLYENNYVNVCYNTFHYII